MDPLPQLRSFSYKTKLQNEVQKANELKEPPLSTSLQHLMRSLPHSVVVLTTSVPRTIYPKGAPKTYLRTEPKNYRGMTLSSFTTLTLSPEPVITFNIKRPSSTLTALAYSHHFLIHILEASENGMKIADAFTKGNMKDTSPFLDRNGSLFKVEHCSTRKDDRVDYKLPMLKADGVIKILRCVLMRTGQPKAESEKDNNKRTKSDRRNSGLLQIGDHTLVVARVEDILGSDGKGAKNGLCYANGSYRKIGDVIKEKKEGKE